MPDFLPRRAADLLHWSANFDRQLTADPQRFGLTAADASAYAQRHAAFAAAYAVAVNPDSRSPTSIRQKDQAEAELKRLARSIAGRARTLSLSDPAVVVALGLRVRARRRRHVAPPEAAPLLSADWPRGHALPLRLLDASSPTRLGKPPGATAATIFTFVGDTPPPPGDPGWRFETQTSRTRLMISFPTHLPPGTKVWITARWFNHRGEPGPCARAIYAHLGAAAPEFPDCNAFPARMAA